MENADDYHSPGEGHERPKATRRGLLASGAAAAGGSTAGCTGFRDSDAVSSPRSDDEPPQQADGESDLTVDRLRTREHPHADVTAHGAVGDGETDDTAVIREAFRSVEDDPDLDTVYVPNGTYLVDTQQPHDDGPPNTALTFRADEMRLAMAPGATLRAAPVEGEHQWRVLGVFGRNDVEIVGGTIDGNRDAHDISDDTSGHGHCMQILGSKDVTVRDLTCRNGWGDGIYISGSGEVAGVAQVYSGGRNAAEREEWESLLSDDRVDANTEHLRIQDFHADNNRRQGISLVSAESVWLVDSVLENTQGTPPEAGLDVETHREIERVSDVTIRNLRTANNVGAGILVFQHAYDEPHDLTIAIDGHTDEGSYMGCVVGGKSGSSDLPGEIQVTNCLWKRPEETGFRLYRWDASLPAVTVNDCTVVDVEGESAFEVGFRGDTYPMGNLEISRPRVAAGEAGLVPENVFRVTGNADPADLPLENVIVRNPRELVYDGDVLETPEPAENQGLDRGIDATGVRW